MICAASFLLFAATLDSQAPTSLSQCLDVGRATEAAGSVAEAYGVLQSCNNEGERLEGSETESTLRNNAVLQNELARLATTLLLCKEAISYMDGALETMQELTKLKKVDGVEAEIDSLELRVLSMKPTLHLIEGNIEAAVSACRQLTSHANYDKQRIRYMMEDSGPIFVYAQNFLQRAVSDAEGNGPKIEVAADVSFSIHSNVGIKLLQVTPCPSLCASSQ